ncbi:GTPase HflX [Rhodopseudomonas palustris]|uniref:GTPase HflX n=1 Tax=Rhodopseudomonas palustris (strain BisB18) TaxID=316056 RepID=Q214Q3_RHOPB
MEPRSFEGDADRPRPSGNQPTGRAVVIGPYLRARRGDPDPQAEIHAQRSSQARLEEAAGLALAIDLTVAEAILAPIGQIRPATYLGKGKVEEILGAIKAHEADLVVMDCALSPIQQRNLEKAWSAKVLDRTGLILEIFGRRAKTKEGALQVELAHLNYQRSRLVRSWTHLERQRGGFGFMGGPGETQIEADRRLIGDRISKIENEIKKVQGTRRLHRAGRQRVPYRVVALVGYTNAGKSTLFNRLTRAEVQAADMLFATLDPTLRALTLPHGGKAMLSDTVGFISNLPTQLVAAFRATLEEVLEADLILHVRDIAHEDADAQQDDVAAVLRQLGIDPEAGGGGRIIEVWNKIDRFAADELANLRNIAARRDPEHPCLLVSAVTGEGIDALLLAIEDRLAAARITLDLSIDAADGAGVSWLHRNAEVLEKELEDGRFVMTVRVDPTKRDTVISRFGAVQHPE